MKFNDQVTIDGTKRRTEDGALLVDARAARIGIQIYGGFEVGRPDLSTVRVLRSADEVFHKDALASFAHRPVTNDHPKDAVTTENWKQVAVGHTADEVKVNANDIFVRVPMMVSDAAAIADIEGGKRELSAGYTCDLDWTAGVTADGQSFDASQRNIRVNHIAIVQNGRAGKDCRIGDSWGGVSPIITKDVKPMKTLLLDGLPINLEDAAMTEPVIKRFQDQLSTATATIAAHVATIAARDTRIGELTADLAKAKDAAPKAAELSKMVQDRAALVTLAGKYVADAKTLDALDDDGIRKAVVAAKLGDDAVKDVNADVIKGMFAAVTKDADKVADGFRQTMVNGQPIPAPTTLADHGQAAYQTRIENAWKQ